MLQTLLNIVIGVLNFVLSFFNVLLPEEDVTEEEKMIQRPRATSIVPITHLEIMLTSELALLIQNHQLQMEYRFYMLSVAVDVTGGVRIESMRQTMDIVFPLFANRNLSVEYRNSQSGCLEPNHLQELNSLADPWIADFSSLPSESNSTNLDWLHQVQLDNQLKYSSNESLTDNSLFDSQLRQRNSTPSSTIDTPTDMPSLPSCDSSDPSSDVMPFESLGPGSEPDTILVEDITSPSGKESSGRRRRRRISGITSALRAFACCSTPEKELARDLHNWDKPIVKPSKFQKFLRRINIFKHQNSPKSPKSSGFFGSLTSWNN